MSAAPVPTPATPVTPATSPTGPLAPGLRTITAAILAMVTVVAFESMAVSTAMPAVADELDAVRGYGLAFSAMLTAQLLGIVLAGVWADRSSPLPGTFAGQLLVGVGSAVCGLAQHYPVFLVGRVVTGLGGGLLVVMLYVIAARVYAESVRPRLFTLISAAWVVPSLAGPPIAAWLTDALSWRWVFLVVVPPCLATFGFFVSQHHRLERDTVDPGQGRGGAAHVRTARVGLALAVSAGAVQFGSTAGSGGWPVAVGLVGLAGVLVTAPGLLTPGTWRMGRGMPSVMLARAVLAGTFYAAISFVPLLVVSLHGRSLLTAGGLVAVGSVGWFVGSWAQGRVGSTYPRHRFVTAGGALLAAGLTGIALLTEVDGPWWVLGLPLACCGLGMGFGVTTTAILALMLSRPEDHGETSSSLQVADVLGGVLGIAGATAGFAAFHGEDDRGLFAAIYLVCGLLAAIAVPAGQRIRT
jgi:MFS family permease